MMIKQVPSIVSASSAMVRRAILANPDLVDSHASENTGFHQAQAEINQVDAALAPPPPRGVCVICVMCVMYVVWYMV